MQFEQINEGVWARAYLIVNEETSDAVLVDPVLDFMERDEELLAARGLKLICVMNTHTHADHVSSAPHLAKKYDCPYLMHENSAVPCADTLVKDLQKMEFAGMEFTFYHTPGHTVDSVTIVFQDKIMTGDFLFNGSGGAGRDDLPGGDLQQHWDALKKLDYLDDSMLVCSGHEPPGLVESTLGENRKSNPVLGFSEFSKYEAWQRGEWEKLGYVSRMKYALPANLSCEMPDPEYFA